MIGIYKITSPSGRIYIGQSTNIEKRFIYYKRLSCKRQIKLYNSLVKHGVKKHEFEIVCECSVAELNDKERHYQELYNCVEIGLNCRLTASNDKSGYFSEETRLRMSAVAIGRKCSDESRLKMSISRTGSKRSESTKKKMSISQTGRVISVHSIEKYKATMKLKRQNGYVNLKKGTNLSEETKARLSIAHTGKKLSKEHREKIRISLLGHKRLNGRTLSDSHKLNCKINATKYKSKLVLDTQNGIFYDSAKELSDLSGIPHSTLRGKLNGLNTNNTNYIYA